MPLPCAGAFFISHQKTGIKMYELFIELLNQIFWEGYAEQLAQTNPAGFQFEYAEFMNSYNQ
jgi:hypothetical protein